MIIIIGFLIAGIAAGQSLITQAKLHKFTNAVTKVYNDVITFKSTYGYYPGDFPHASAYWNGQTDGNGDDIISYNSLPTEYIWDQLKLANISTREMAYDDPCCAIIDGTKGIGAMDINSYFSINTPVVINGVGIWDDSNIGLFSATDTYNIDNKIDDGKPETGAFLAYDWPDCTVNPNSGPDTTYKLDSTDARGCYWLVYLIDTKQH